METWQKRDNPTVIVEAVRLTEENVHEVSLWCNSEKVEEIDPEHTEEMQFGINVMTAHGPSRASLGMYVIRFGNQFFVSHNRPFEMKYEPTSRPAPPLESAGDARKARGWADPFDRGRMGP